MPVVVGGSESRVPVTVASISEEDLRDTSDPGDTKELGGPESLEDRVRVIVSVSRPVLVVVIVNVLVDAGWSEPASVLLAKELMEPGSTSLVLTGAEIAGSESEVGCVESEETGSDDEASGSDDEVEGSDDEAAGSNEDEVGGAVSEASGSDDEAAGSDDEDEVGSLDSEAAGTDVEEAGGEESEVVGAEDESD